MSNIHLLGGIINDLENELAKYAKTQKASQHIIKIRQDLIDSLSEIYESYNYITMWDVFERIQADMDVLREKDKELTHVIIILPLRPCEFNAHRCCMLDYSDREERERIEYKTYLNESV